MRAHCVELCRCRASLAHSDGPAAASGRPRAKAVSSAELARGATSCRHPMQAQQDAGAIRFVVNLPAIFAKVTRERSLLVIARHLQHPPAPASAGAIAPDTVKRRLAGVIDGGLESSGSTSTRNQTKICSVTRCSSKRMRGRAVGTLGALDEAQDLAARLRHPMHSFSGVDHFELSWPYRRAGWSQS